MRLGIGAFVGLVTALSGVGISTFDIAFSATGTGAQTFTGTGSSTFDIGFSAAGTGSKWDPDFDAVALVADWDPASGVTVTSGKITAWVDKFGSHSVTGVANGPVLTASGLGSDSTVDFAGAATTVALQGTFTLNQPAMCCAVMKCTPGTSAVNDIVFDGKTIVTFVIAVDATPNTAFNCGSALSTAFAIANAVWKYCSFVSKASNSGQVWENGVSKIGPGNVGTGNPGGFTIGGLANLTRSAPVKFARILLFSSDADRANAELYLSLRYPLAA